MKKKYKYGLGILAFLCLGAIIISYFCQCIGPRSIATVYSASEINNLSSMALSGDAKSQELLGRAYKFGDGVEQNYAEAAKWLIKSAEQGNTHVLFDIASIYREGDEHLKPDVKEAYFWYSVAVVRGETSNTSRRDSILQYLTQEQRLILDKRVAEWINSYPIK